MATSDFFKETGDLIYYQVNVFVNGMKDDHYGKDFYIRADAEHYTKKILKEVKQSSVSVCRIQKTFLEYDETSV